MLPSDNELELKGGIMGLKKKYFLPVVLLIGLMGCAEKRRAENFIRSGRGIRSIDNQGVPVNPVYGSSAGRVFALTSFTHPEDIKLFLSYAYEVPQESIIQNVALVGDIYPLGGSQFSPDSWLEVVVQDDLSAELGLFQVGFSPQRGGSINGYVSNSNFNVQFQDPQIGSIILDGRIMYGTTIQGSVTFIPGQSAYNILPSNQRVVLGEFNGIEYCWLFRCDNNYPNVYTKSQH